MPLVYLHRVTASEDDLDPLGHVNNVVYIRWMQEAAIAHSTAQGWPMSRYREAGAGWVVRKHAIEYLAPAVLGDVVAIRTWVADMQRVTSLRRYEMFREELLLARAETQWAFIRTADSRLMRIPPERSGAFELAPDGPLPGNA
jgi:acyl-CoA thioester hydrolase